MILFMLTLEWRFFKMVEGERQIWATLNELQSTNEILLTKIKVLEKEILGLKAREAY